MKKETFALDQFRQRVGEKHSLKENQQQRKKPKHPKQVVTWGVLPFFPLTMWCHPAQSKGGQWQLQPARGQYTCLHLGLEGAQCSQGVGRSWDQCSSGESGADKDYNNRREQGKGHGDPWRAEALRGLFACQLGYSNVEVGIFWQNSGETRFCAGKPQVRVQGSVAGVGMEIGAYWG